MSPPILYIADTFNNRVLAFKNATALTKGNTADRVIGQRDLQSTNPQGPGSGSGGLTTGLSQPTGIAVDKNGNLYVIDAKSGNLLKGDVIETEKDRLFEYIGEKVDLEALGYSEPVYLDANDHGLLLVVKNQAGQHRAIG